MARESDLDDVLQGCEEANESGSAATRRAHFFKSRPDKIDARAALLETALDASPGHVEEEHRKDMFSLKTDREGNLR
jgi:hypothetical protein